MTSNNKPVAKPKKTLVKNMDTAHARTEELEHYFNLSLDLLCIADTDGYFHRLNPEWEKILGYPLADLEGRKFLDFVHPEDMEATLIAITRLGAQETVLNFENRFRCKDGSYRWLEWRSQPVGKLIYAVARDVTAHKQMEQALRKSEARARAMLDAIPDLIFRLDRQGVFLDYKADVTDLYTQSGNFIGKRNRDITPPEFADLSDRKIQAALETGVLQTFEYQLPMPERGLRNYEARMTPSGADEVMVIVRDITERTRIEDDIRRLNENLEQRVEERTRELRKTQKQLVQHEKLAVLGQLAGGVGHELRNPLGVISNAVYFLKMAQPDASEKIKEYLDIIEREMRISEKIVSDLLDFTRVKSVERQPVDVTALIHQAFERFPAPGNVHVEIDLPADLPQAYVDSTQIVQVLGNLIINAYQAMPPRASAAGASNDGKLVVRAHTAQNMICISVQDTGTGIPAENMDKIFEPLFTTRTKGIGLGLAVSRRLAEANGGRLEAQSEVAQGSTFNLWLPVPQ